MQAGPEQHGPAVVCAVVPYGDDDAVVRLFTPELGRVGAFARKARASRRRFAGLTAPALCTVRLQPRRGSDLYELKELDQEPLGLAFAADPRALGYAAYLCELVERLVPEAEANAAVFRLVYDGVASVARHGARPVLLRTVELQLLLHIGYLPELVVVDDPLAPCVAFDPGRGALLARASASAVPFSEQARLLACRLVGAQTLDALPDLPVDELRAVSRIFSEHLRRHLSGPLKSVGFLRALEGVEAARPSR